jgi:copper(I)-binding protein
MQPAHAIQRPTDMIRAAVLLLVLLAVAGCVAPATTVSTAPATTVSTAPATTVSTAPATTVSTAPPSHGSGMNIIDAQAMPIPGNGDPVIVVATIRNGTGRDDKLVGGSSPVAAAVGLYATCGCSPAPTDPVTGIPGVAPFPWWLIKANETIQLRAGDGEMVLSGLSQPMAAGQTVEVTFKFAYAAPVTVQIPVVSAIGTAATASSQSMAHAQSHQVALAHTR